MDEFIQQLLHEQGIPEDLDPAVRAELVSGLTTRATDFLYRQLIDAMSDEVVERFNALLDAGSADVASVQDFINANVPDKERVVATALADFRLLYLGDKARET